MPSRSYIAVSYEEDLVRIDRFEVGTGRLIANIVQVSTKDDERVVLENVETHEEVWCKATTTSAYGRQSIPLGPLPGTEDNPVCPPTGPIGGKSEARPPAPIAMVDDQPITEQPTHCTRWRPFNNGVCGTKLEPRCPPEGDTYFWACPSCGSSYGPVDPPTSASDALESDS